MKAIISGSDHNIEIDLDFAPSPDIKYFFGDVWGVQDVKIFRYQVRIKIGKAFNPSLVIERIQKAIALLYEGIEIIENLSENGY